MRVNLGRDGEFTLLLESAEEAIWLSERALELAEDFSELAPEGMVAIQISDCHKFEWGEFALDGLFCDEDEDDEGLN